MNMQAWTSTIVDLLSAMPGHPGPEPGLRMGLILFAGAAGFVLILGILARSFELKRNGLPWILTLAAMGFAIALACLAAVCIYVQPHVPGSLLKPWLVWIAFAAVFLVVLVPLGCFFLKSRYLAVATLLLLSSAAGAGAMLLMRAAHDAVAHGSAGFDTVKTRTDSIDDAIKEEK